ncbi:hypothetical protein BT93_C2263 [Corymbia citriodora subsp. variegata]|nr:hypothetical protein BT93_C2263 [Corymbia citriodora subsp. variegata]
MAEHQSIANGSLKTYDDHVPEIKFTKLFINGKFVDSVKGRTFETIDPRNGQVTARVAEGDKEDVDLAVKAARQAFDHGPWPRMPGYLVNGLEIANNFTGGLLALGKAEPRLTKQRGRIMLKFADLIEENIDELAALDTINAGKLFSLAKASEIPHAATLLRYYAGAADKIHGEVLKMSCELHAYTLREPIGVVGHIIPWNAPTTVFMLKVAPALAAGCTMVMKPAEQSPLSALFYAHLAEKVSFTGSTEVGRIVMQAAATSNLKQVSLELGGKSPFIIFDDADLDTATDLALTGVLHNKGEICVAGSRVYVQEGIYEEFEKKLVAKAKAWSVGDPFDPNVHQGPQVDRKQFEKILSYIEHGKREGATLLTGGGRLGSEGYYIQPTIFTDVKEDSVIMKDEIFGPIMSLMKFRTTEEVIERANNTRYGLAAGVLTKNIDLANTVSRSIRAGIIWINCYLAIDNDCPYGGYKMSGFGRDLGLDGLHKYLHVKSVVTPIYNSPWL